MRSPVGVDLDAIDGASAARMEFRALELFVGVALKQRSYAKARRVLHRQVTLRPEDGRIWQLWAGFEARASSAEERWAVSRTFYRAAAEALMRYNGKEWQRLGSDPKLVKALMDWGAQEMRAGNAVSARRLFRRSVDEAARHPDGVVGGGGLHTLHLWARLERKIGLPRQAKSLINEGLEHDPHNPYLWLLKGKMFSEQGMTNAARGCFSSGLKMNPRFAGIYNEWAKLEMHAGDIRTVRTIFADLLDINPDDVKTLQSWAVAEARIGDPQRARTLFQRAASRQPNNTKVLNAWGRMELSRGGVDRARELYTQALSFEPENRHTLVALAHLEQHFGDLAAAEGLLATAHSLDQDDTAVLQEMGHLRKRLGDHGAAEELFAAAEDLDRKQRRRAGQQAYAPVRQNKCRYQRRLHWLNKTKAKQAARAERAAKRGGGGGS